RTYSPGPQPTASLATTKPPSLRFSGFTCRSRRNLSPSILGSFRVATTVPTTFARSMATPRPRLLLAAVRADLLLDLSLTAEREDEVDVDVRAGDDVGRDDVADARRPVLARVHGRLHGRHVAADDGGHVTAPRLLVAHELHLRGLHHRVGRFDHRREGAALDHSQCFSHFDPPCSVLHPFPGRFGVPWRFLKTSPRARKGPGSPARPQAGPRRCRGPLPPGRPCRTSQRRR